MSDTTSHDQLHDRRASDRREAKIQLKKKAKRRQRLIMAGYAFLVLGNAAGIAKSYDVSQDNHDDSDRKSASIAKIATQAKYDAAFQDYASCLRGNDLRDVVVTSISGSLSAALSASMKRDSGLEAAGIKRVQDSVDRQLKAVTDTKRECVEPPVEPGVSPRVLRASDFGNKGMNKR